MNTPSVIRCLAHVKKAVATMVYLSSPTTEQIVLDTMNRIVEPLDVESGERIAVSATVAHILRLDRDETDKFLAADEAEQVTLMLTYTLHSIAHKTRIDSTN